MAIIESRIDDIALLRVQNHPHKSTPTPCTSSLLAPKKFNASENLISRFALLKSLLLPLFIRYRIVLNGLQMEI
jgi:hypothetical protein